MFIGYVESSLADADWTSSSTPAPSLFEAQVGLEDASRAKVSHRCFNQTSTVNNLKIVIQTEDRRLQSTSRRSVTQMSAPSSRQTKDKLPSIGSRVTAILCTLIRKLQRSNTLTKLELMIGRVRSFAEVGGFKQPILHGLCSFGIAGKAAYDRFGRFSDIKVRFAGHLFPGETLVTSFWHDKSSGKVTFVSRCKERGTVVLSNAAVTLAK